MFNWFNKKPVPEPVKTVVTPLPPPKDPIAFQVGKTEEGKTTLRLGDGYGGYGIVTMNDRGVEKLIEMLQAAIEGQVKAVEGPK